VRAVGLGVQRDFDENGRVQQPVHAMNDHWTNSVASSAADRGYLQSSSQPSSSSSPIASSATRQLDDG
jgi:hypothetical protein